MCLYRYICGVFSVSYLIVYKLGGVLQVHLVPPQRGVAGGEGQAAEGVAPRAPLLDDGQEVVFDGAGQRNPGGSHTDVRTAVDDSFWSSLVMKVI